MVSFKEIAVTPDPSSPNVVARDLSEHEAMQLVTHLRDLGFEAQPWGTNVAALCLPFTAGFSAQVVVKESEAERARTAVEEFRRRQPAPAESAK